MSAPTNVSYLTGFTGDSSVLIVGRERDLIISDGRFTTQLEQECPGLEASIRLPGQEMNPAIAQVLETMGLRRRGPRGDELDGRRLPGARAAAAGRVAWSGSTGRVEALRQIKDDGEIAAIREAVRCAERAFTMLRAGLRDRGNREGRRRRAGRLPAPLRRDRGELSADRGGGSPIGLAARPADGDDRGSARTISS